MTYARFLQFLAFKMIVCSFSVQIGLLGSIKVASEDLVLNRFFDEVSGTGKCQINEKT